jgi:Flp pilus assembly protein CpaB
MKNVSGLIIAIGLGLAGAVLNWFYLEQESRQLERLNFIGVRSAVNRGDVLREDNLVPVPIPREAARGLEEYAVLWDARQTVVGRAANRPYPGGELVLRQDLQSPPSELKLEKNERAMWIPVDSTSFVAQLVKPGDDVSFLISRYSPGSPTPAMPVDPDAPQSAEPAKPQGGSEMVGPFRILSLGNRLGSAEVMQAYKIPQVQENVLTILVRVDGDKLEPKAQKLWDLLKATNFRQVGVLLHQRNE